MACFPIKFSYVLKLTKILTVVTVQMNVSNRGFYIICHIIQYPFIAHNNSFISIYIQYRS